MKYSDSSISKRKIKNHLSGLHGNFCQYCGIETEPSKATIDHITPQSSGGSDDISNLIYCCKSCNSAKNNRELSYFRLIRSVQNSPYSGILTANQYLKLLSLNLLSFEVDLIRFHFELEVEL